MDYDDKNPHFNQQSNQGYPQNPYPSHIGFPSFPTGAPNPSYHPQMPGFQFPVPQGAPNQIFSTPGNNSSSQPPIFNHNAGPQPTSPTSPVNTSIQFNGSTATIGKIGRPQPGLKWAKTSGRHIPEGAVQGGFEADGKPLYIARGYHKGSLVVGKAGGHINGCLVPFGGKEVAIHDYHVLVGSADLLKWRECYGKLVVDGWVPLEAGNEPNGEELFIAKTFYKKSEVVGKVSCEMSYGMSFGYDGKEITPKDSMVYHVLSHT